jgi:hypothetical protein
MGGVGEVMSLNADSIGTTEYSIGEYISSVNFHSRYIPYPAMD